MKATKGNFMEPNNIITKTITIKAISASSSTESIIAFVKDYGYSFARTGDVSIIQRKFASLNENVRKYLNPNDVIVIDNEHLKIMSEQHFSAQYKN